MKKKVVHRFSIPLAHAISIHHDHMPPSKIIQSEDLPRAAYHAKNAALKGAKVHLTLFQGKLLPSEQAKELYKDLTLNKPLLGGVHNSLSTY